MNRYENNPRSEGLTLVLQVFLTTPRRWFCRPGTCGACGLYLQRNVWFIHPLCSYSLVMAEPGGRYFMSAGVSVERGEEIQSKREGPNEEDNGEKSCF